MIKDSIKRKCTVLTDHTKKAPKNTKKRRYEVAFDISQSESFNNTMSKRMLFELK